MGFRTGVRLSSSPPALARARISLTRYIVREIYFVRFGVILILFLLTRTDFYKSAFLQQKAPPISRGRSSLCSYFLTYLCLLTSYVSRLFLPRIRNITPAATMTPATIPITISLKLLPSSSLLSDEELSLLVTAAGV